MRTHTLTTFAVTAALALGAALTTTASAATDPQSIRWHSCTTGPDDALGARLDRIGAACGEVTVPVDYRQPHGRTIAIALSRVRATDPARRRGVLLMNPGGPGGSGLTMAGFGRAMPDVAARYDLVGMDPRFVGRSGPSLCSWSTTTPARSAGPNRHTFQESVAFAKELAHGCATGTEELLPHASTRNTARDIDRIRQALGERRISYLGYSYGTYLGAVYLQMFGDHADRVVLDSAVDPDVYGPNLMAPNAPAMDAALRRWAEWAAQHDGEVGLGRTADEVISAVHAVERAAARQPIAVGAHAVDAHVFPYLVSASLYDDSPETYAGLAETVSMLSASAAGEAATPPEGLEEFLDGLATGSGDAADREGMPVLCADRAVSRDPPTYFHDIQQHRRSEPLFGPLNRNITPCAFWPTHPVEAPTTIQNASPALVVGSDGDVATPYAGQLAMHRRLTGSRMVTLDGRFAHGQFLFAGNGCVDGTVGRYLLDGVLPARDLHCALGS